MYNNFFIIFVGIFIIWSIYLTVLVMSSEILFWFLKLSKKIFFSQLDFVGTFIISIFVCPLSLYIPLTSTNSISSEIIGIFIFLPTIFFYNKIERIEVMRSTIKIALLLLFIKLFLTKDYSIVLIKNELINFLFDYFKAVIYSIFYTEILKVLSIVVNYLKKEDKK